LERKRTEEPVNTETLWWERMGVPTYRGARELQNGLKVSKGGGPPKKGQRYQAKPKERSKKHAESLNHNDELMGA